MTTDARPSTVLSDQYQETTLADLVDALGYRLRERLAEPMSALALQWNPAVAEGVWLDYLGQRLGLPRPLIHTGAFFGFDNAGVAFDQAGFVSPASRYASQVGVADPIYRRLLQARAAAIRGAADGPTLAAILAGLFAVGEVGDYSSLPRFGFDNAGVAFDQAGFGGGRQRLHATLHIPQDADPLLQSIVRELADKLLPRPAGVTYDLVADLPPLSPIRRALADAVDVRASLFFVSLGITLAPLADAAQATDAAPVHRIVRGPYFGFNSAGRNFADARFPPP